MKINPYVSFKGDCETAFNFYERCLGGRLGPLFRYAGSPMADQVPADWEDKVMHGSVIVGELQLMGADVMPLVTWSPKASRSHSKWTIPPRPSAFLTSSAKTAALPCRSRRRSGPSGLAWWSTGSGFRG